jgi:ArsR family transcriptional regulator
LTIVVISSNIRNISKDQNTQLDGFAGIFKALGNSHRLSIFLRLARCCCPGEISTDEEMRACVGELGRDLGLAASTVSHHLKELRRAELIRMERAGQTVECWVEPKTLEALAGFFRGAGGPSLPRGETSAT